MAPSTLQANNLPKLVVLALLVVNANSCALVPSRARSLW